jgi:hypothetical protein
MDDFLTNDQSKEIDFQAFHELMELVFAYTSAAHDFGFTHKMNNRFTALSMNASFLRQALENGQYEKASAKATQVSESISNLVQFSQDLMSTDLIPSEAQELVFPGMISNTIDKLLFLPPFKKMELDLDLCRELASTKVNAGIIWIVLFAYFKNTLRYEIDGPIQLSTAIDKIKNQYLIRARVKHILQAPGPVPDISALIFPSAGEIPLRYLARVIRNVSDKFELILQTDRPLNIELRIDLNPKQ